MIQHFQIKYALSEKGARDLAHSIFWTLLMNLSFMFPVIVAFLFLDPYVGADSVDPTAGSKGTLYYVGIGAGLLLLMYILAYFQYNSAYTKIYEESAQKRIHLAETLKKLPLAFFGQKDIADLSATIMDDVTQIETLFSHSVPEIYGAVIALGIMAVMMFSYNWQLSLAVFWVVPVAIFVFSLTRTLQSRIHAELYQTKRDISDTIQEQLDTAQEIKAYNKETYVSERLNAKLDAYEKALLKSELVIGSLINLSQAFLKLGLPTVLFYGAHLLNSDRISIFTYLVFLIVSSRVYNPIMDAMNNFALLLFLRVRIERMREMDAMPLQEGATSFAPEGFDIQFEDVNFSYQEDVQTLKGVTLTAKQGEVTALVGPSGGGKSTVAKLAARFWDVDSGRITLGGQDISKVDPETLLQYYAIVFQDVTLFNASVMDNIRLGKKDATDAEVMRAAALAQCQDFIEKLPEGYNTLIGENGERLSGGERQRISIARAILKDAPVILLDEATASLDTENETKIQRALSALIRDKTVLIIAHRMRTVSAADKIIVIKNGRPVEVGSPDLLSTTDGFFSKMLTIQKEATV